MKIYNITNIRCLILLLVITLFSCGEETIKNTPSDDFNIWVLNEGLMMMNNGSITAYNTSTNERVEDIYSYANNGQQLGDTPNDILLYGSKIYVAVDISKQINVLDSKSGVSIKQIPINEPRHIACHNGKIYICCFDGSVVKIDTTSLMIEVTAKAGRNPDGICVSNNKLYVSNSGGLDYPNCDNTVSVFDLNTLNKIKNITVRINPRQMKADKNGYVYVVSNEVLDDDWVTKLSSSCLQRINSTTDQVEVLFEEISDFDIYDNLLYYYSYDYVSPSYHIFDLLQNKIINTDFISGGNVPTIPHGINTNPSTGDVYIFGSIDYTSTGDVYCFDKNGTKKFQFEAGIGPKKLVFKKF